MCDGTDDCGDMSDELAGCSRETFYNFVPFKLSFSVCVLLYLIDIQVSPIGNLLMKKDTLMRTSK